MQIRTNTTASLYWFIDQLSMWDPNGNEGYKTYIDQHAPLTSQETEILDQFKSIRKQLGLDANKNLLDWAYNGFPEKKEYQQLKTVVDALKEKKLDIGVSLEEIIRQKIPALTSLSDKLLEGVTDDKVSNTLKKLKALDTYGYGINFDQLLCYLAYCPSSRINGYANGGVIILDVNYAQDGDHFLTTVIHESVHLLVPIWKRAINDRANGQFFMSPASWMPTRKNHSIFNELLAYTVQTLFSKKESIADQVNYFKKKVFEEERTDLRDLLFIWEHVEDFQQVIKNFLDGTINAEECYKSMIERYMNYTKETL